MNDHCMETLRNAVVVYLLQEPESNLYLGHFFVRICEHSEYSLLKIGGYLSPEQIKQLSPKDGKNFPLFQKRQLKVVDIVIQRKREYNFLHDQFISKHSSQKSGLRDVGLNFHKLEYFSKNIGKLYKADLVRFETPVENNKYQTIPEIVKRELGTLSFVDWKDYMANTGHASIESLCIWKNYHLISDALNGYFKGQFVNWEGRVVHIQVSPWSKHKMFAILQVVDFEWDEVKVIPEKNYDIGFLKIGDTIQIAGKIIEPKKQGNSFFHTVKVSHIIAKPVDKKLKAVSSNSKSFEINNSSFIKEMLRIFFRILASAALAGVVFDYMGEYEKLVMISFTVFLIFAVHQIGSLFFFAYGNKPTL